MRFAGGIEKLIEHWDEHYHPIIGHGDKPVEFLLSSQQYSSLTPHSYSRLLLVDDIFIAITIVFFIFVILPNKYF